MFCNCSSAYWSCVSMFHENKFSWGAYYAPDTLTHPFDSAQGKIMPPKNLGGLILIPWIFYLLPPLDKQ